MESKTISSKELFDKDKNPTLCLSALRVFADCINCDEYQKAKDKSKLKCKPNLKA